MKHAALLVVLLAFGSASARPGVITGRVYDPAEDRPVEYANIILYRVEDSVQVTGTVTDARGGFELTGVEPGGYYLELSFIGFSSRRVDDVALSPGARLDLGRIPLVAQPLPVEGAEVVAERPAVRYEIDKRVIDVGALPVAASGTAVDALETAPGVTVDIEGNVSLRGSGNFKVLVDGKPTMLESSDALRQIPAGAIDRIEIITNPSAMHDPDGSAGIINVIMKRQRQAGWSALTNLSGGLNETHGGDLLLGYRQGRVNAYAGGDLHRRGYRSTIETRYRVFSGSDTSGFTSSGDQRWQGDIGGGRGGLELRTGERGRFGLSGAYRRLDFGNEFFGRQTRFGGLEAADPVLDYESRSGQEQRGRVLSLNADHHQELDTAGQAITAEIWYGHRAWATGNTNELADTGIASRQERESDLVSAWSRFKTEYALPRREKDKLELGYQVRYELVEEDGRQEVYHRAGSGYAEQIEPESVAVHIVTGRRVVHSLYGSYAWNWRALGVKTGLRGEYKDRRIELAGAAEPWEFRRPDLFPTAHIALGLPAGQQATASYSRRIERAQQWHLQPYEVWDSPTSIRVGNPELRPELINSWELGYQLPLAANLVAVEAYWRTTADPVQQVFGPHPDRPGVSLARSLNTGSARSAGGQLTLNWRPVRFWGISLTGNLYDYRLEGEIDGRSLARRSINRTGRFSTDLTLPTHTRLQLTGFFSGPAVTAQGRQEGYLVTSAALRQSFLDRALTVTLRVRDLSGPGRWESSAAGPEFDSYVRYAGEARVLSLALTWNFNNFRLDRRMREPEGMEVPAGPQL